MESALALVLPHLGFGGVKAAEGPLAADQVVEASAGFGGGGAVVLVILVDELLEIDDFFGWEDEGFGVDAGFIGLFTLETRNPLKLKSLKGLHNAKSQ